MYSVQRFETLKENKQFKDHNAKRFKVVEKGTPVIATYRFDIDCNEKEKDLIANIVSGIVTAYGKKCCDLDFLNKEADEAYSKLKRKENLFCDVELVNFQVYYNLCKNDGRIVNCNSYVDFLDLRRSKNVDV